MVWWHMLFNRFVLPTPPVEPSMRANATALKEYFNYVARQAHVHFSLDVFVGDGVIHLIIHCNMVIERDGSDLPRRQFKWAAGKR